MFKKSLDMEKLEKVISKFSNDRNWDQFHSIKNLSMALSVETSELVEIFQWMSEADSNAIMLNEEKFSDVKDEVADIFVYLLRISSKLNIDLEEVVLKKMKDNEVKYPVETSHGDSRKYNEKS